nr:P2X purinoceptor 1 isoform X2 [Anas platyrhynchos]
MHGEGVLLPLRVRHPSDGAGEEQEGGTDLPADPAHRPGVHHRVGFPLREGLPVAGQHRQLGVGEAQRHNADQRERPGPAHLGRGGLRFPTAGGQLFRGDDQLHYHPWTETRNLPGGLRTGRCVNFNSSVKTCEIFGWCPVEVDYHVPNPALLSEAEKFTLFIKNSITFPRFKVSRRNLVESVTKDYLKKCTYHKVTDSLCPVFGLGYVVKESGQNFTVLAVKGGVVGITIDWNCDLDWPVRHCKPVYQFHGLYNDDSNVSPGFNFRYAKYYKEDGTDKRTLYKVFGIRFDILVNGKAGKFDIIPTMTTIGSGIGIFGVASVLCDLLLLHFLQGRDYYKQKKFKYAEQEPSKSHKKGKELDNTQ